MIRLLLVFAENLDRRYGARIAVARRRLALEVGRTRQLRATWSILSLGALTRSLVTKRPRDP